MNIPLSLYDYLALLVPGTLVLVGFAPALDIDASHLRSAGVLEMIVIAVSAFVVGHFNQWLTKATLVSAAQFFPAFDSAAAFLLRRPYPSSASSSPQTFFRRVFKMIQVLFPFYWGMQRISEERAARIAKLLEQYYGYSIRPEEVTGKILSALDNSNRSEVRAKRDLFQAQADFLRGTATALLILSATVMNWGLADFLAPNGLPGPSRIYVAGFLVVVAGAFVKRYLHYEFNSASLLFSSFEGLSRMNPGSPGPALVQAAASKND